jgi:Rps23 Pro-64 3,4-dihydroxylase Tpa1-like proline 4-hydroxylase
MKLQIINQNALSLATASFHNALPFDHCIVDNFICEEYLESLSSEFLNYESEKWFVYKNALEHKKALNDWNAFPPATYKLFAFLNSAEFISNLSDLLKIKLLPDNGLHGGGWHIHGEGGVLNPHLDYNIHPKLGLKRKINIIIYFSNNLTEKNGGHLGLWNHDPERNCPGSLQVEIAPKFNRAVIFDTTQNSWHGISRKLNISENIFRKSFAIYYLCAPNDSDDMRYRALYAPTEEQKSNQDVLDLIKKRADLNNSINTYIS